MKDNYTREQITLGPCAEQKISFLAWSIVPMRQHLINTLRRKQIFLQICYVIEEPHRCPSAIHLLPYCIKQDPCYARDPH